MASTAPAATGQTGAMVTILGGPYRWILLGLTLLLSLWFWQQSFHPAPQASSVFIPAKLYEPGAIASTDNLAHQPRPVSV